MLSSPLAIWALDPSRSVFQYGAQNWSRRNGMPVNAVKAITQTKDGYIWLGTQNGLVRFDGMNFVSFQVPDDPMFVSQNISRLAAARGGGLWFGLKEGAVGHFDGRNFAPLRAPWVEPHMEIFALDETSDGALWVGWTFGFARWRDERTEILAADLGLGSLPIHAIHEDSKGRVWLGAGDNGKMFFWEGGALHSVPDANIENLYYYTIAEDRQGNLWLGTNLGLFCYDREMRRKELPSHISGRINTVLVDRHGVVWVGTVESGLLCYKDGKFMRFGKAEGLLDENVLALYEDIEGSLWVGTQGGLTQLSDVKFATYSTTEGLAGEPLGVAVSRTGTLWVGTARGITHLNGAQTRSYREESGLNNTWVRRVWEAADGDVYSVGGDKEVTIMAEGKVVARHPTATWASAFAEDGRGMIVSVGTGLHRVSREGMTPLTFQSHETGQPTPLGWVVNIWTGREGVWWLATHDGVWRLQGGTARQWSVQHGLSSRIANWIFEDEEGAAWAGLATGLARFKDGQLRNIGRKDGLFANVIHAIVPDDFGWFWLDSNRGIFRVRRQELNDFADGKIARIQCEVFSGQHVVKSSDKGQQEMIGVKTRDGRIWFPTTQGVIAIDPARVPVNQVAPPVYIEGVRVNGAEHTAASLQAVAAGKGELEFRYTALSFIAPEGIRFRYQLEGYDEHWIEAEGRRAAFYTNLGPGQYVFRVQACNADGVWNQAGQQLAFELLPHFYQTRWFAGLCAGLFLASLGGVYAWRTGALRRRERSLQALNDRLEEGVRERTAELERANTLLREHIAERERMELAAEEANKQLLLASRQAGMAEVATSVLHNVGNVLNSVNVSAILLAEQLRKSRVASLAKLAKLLEENADTPDFLRANEKGKRVPIYVDQLALELNEERTRMREEIEALRKNVEHIKEIVQMQQSFSRMSGVSEQVTIDDIVEDTLRLNGASLLRHEVAIEREIEPGIQLVVEKHKVLQILVNLIRNAVLACKDANRADAKIVIRARRRDEGLVRIEVTDNGVGIPPENLTRIFTQGFTTRKSGHGYGLHSSANAAKAMGGSLAAHSEGAGRGATFVLELPLRQRGASSRAPFAVGVASSPPDGDSSG